MASAVSEGPYQIAASTRQLGISCRIRPCSWHCCQPNQDFASAGARVGVGDLRFRAPTFQGHARGGACRGGVEVQGTIEWLCSIGVQERASPTAPHPWGRRREMYPYWAAPSCAGVEVLYGGLEALLTRQNAGSSEEHLDRVGIVGPGPEMRKRSRCIPLHSCVPVGTQEKTWPFCPRGSRRCSPPPSLSTWAVVCVLRHLSCHRFRKTRASFQWIINCVPLSPIRPR